MAQQVTAGNPDHLKYTKTHEWSRTEANGEITVGITDYAQDLLGDLVFVDLPVVGQYFTKNEVCMLVESVKSASDIYMPISANIVAVNMMLTDNPENINDDPFDNGWLFRCQPDNNDDITELLSAQAYEALLDG